jgi:LMBR1-like membrane protein
VYRDGILGCVIGLSLVFGLLSIVLLLGYGLVKIPVAWFRHASNRKKLALYQSRVAEYDEKLKEKAKKVQTLVEIIREVQVEPEINEFKQVLRKDVDRFNEVIETLDYFRLTFTPSISDKAAREFHGVLDYNRLVRLRNRFIYQTTDVIRLISFRREAIETAILTQDILNGQQSG